MIYFGLLKLFANWRVFPWKGHQHGVFIQSFVDLGETPILTTRELKTAKIKMHMLFLFHIGGAPPAEVRNLSELEVSLENLKEFVWEKILLCMYFWSVRGLRTTVANMLTLTRNTVGNMCSLLRHYCGRDLQDRLGDRVYVVKCDESQFKHKSKVSR